MKIKISCDDGSVHDLKLAEMLDKYNLPGIFYIPVEWRNVLPPERKPMSLDQFHNLASRYEIGSHTLTHPHLTKIGIPEARYEITESRKILQDMTGQPINSFCYPRGYNNQKIRELVEEAGYTDARTTAVGQFTISENPYADGTSVHVYNGRTEYKGKGWLTYAKGLLKIADNAERIVIENNSTEQIEFHLWCHGWEVERDNLWNELDIFLKTLGEYNARVA